MGSQAVLERELSGSTRGFPAAAGSLRVVVFDLDDTLYLENDYVRSGFHAVAALVRRKLGLRGFFKSAWDRFTSGRRELLFNRVLEERGIRPARPLIKALLACYRSHAPVVRLAPDARRFLERPPEGISIGVVTDGRYLTQRLKVQALGVHRLAAAVEYSGRWGRRYAKPHPRAFRRIQRRFRVPGAACLYVGDHPAKDFPGPRELGWSVCRIRRPGGMFESAKSPDVAEIADCDELASILTLARVAPRHREASLA